MEKLLIQNARALDPSQKLDGALDLLAVDGRIAALAPKLDCSDAVVVDGTGLVLAPGLVDMHVHLRDPGYTYKEDILTGCAAAAAGGFTTVACMPNTNPVCDSVDVVNYIVEKSRSAKAKVYPIAAITKALQSGECTEIAALHKAGAVGLSDDGRPVTNNRLMLEALRAARDEGMCVISHAEDLDVTNRGIMHRGAVSERLGVRGVDRASEDCGTAVVLALAEASGTAVHIAHVSTRGAVAMIRDAKRRGARVTCETGPHYFTLTQEELLRRDANYRMAPPLREESDRLAVLEGIADGTIDCIATDHAPHSPAEKADFETAPNGVVGLETSLALCLTHLVKPGVITLSRLLEMMTVSPAKILGVKAGTLQIGAPADLVLFDPAESWTVDSARFYSKGRNTCFQGAAVTGRVRCTFLNGNMTYGMEER